MNIRNNAFCLKGHFFGSTLAFGLFFSLNLSAGLSIPKLGEIKDEFFVTWDKKSFYCKLSLGTEQKLTLTVTPLGHASPPQHYILHNNLIESLALSIVGTGLDDHKSKYAKYIIAMVASIVVLPDYPYFPNLILPAYADTAYDEVGFHVYLSGLKSSESSVYSVIDITESSSPLNYNVTVNKLNAEGLSQTLLVQFLEDWVDLTGESHTWFEDYKPENKGAFFHFEKY